VCLNYLGLDLQSGNSTSAAFLKLGLTAACEASFTVSHALEGSCCIRIFAVRYRLAAKSSPYTFGFDFQGVPRRVFGLCWALGLQIAAGLSLTASEILAVFLTCLRCTKAVRQFITPLPAPARSEWFDRRYQRWGRVDCGA
jgi:hypothetical protein